MICPTHVATWLLSAEIVLGEVVMASKISINEAGVVGRRGK